MSRKLVIWRFLFDTMQWLVNIAQAEVREDTVGTVGRWLDMKPS